ncbi:MAG: glycosyltransferase [Eubacteriales bacterium]|nr:glycosyltransferase [Eubacteriales bacterium]
MIKILHVISDSNIGGAGRYLLTYLSECDREKFDVTVVLPTGSKLEAAVVDLGFTVITCDGLAEKSFSKTGLNELVKIIKRVKPHMVHSHAVLSARIAAKLVSRKIKVVYTRHSVFPPKENLTKGIGRFANSLLNKRAADGIIAVAQAAKENLTDTGVEDAKVRVIYNGVKDVTVLTPEEKRQAKADLGLISDATIVAIVARLTEVKGHKYYIETAKILKDKGYNVQFVIAGTGECEEELKAQAKRDGLGETVVFTGFLTNVTPLMNVLDIQANASFGTEAASLSLLEGMCLGKPAVVSDYGGNPELIKNGQNGFVVPIKDPQAMADKIEQLINDKDLYNTVSDGAKEIFQRGFTAKAMVEQMEDYYCEILADCKKERAER